MGQVTRRSARHLRAGTATQRLEALAVEEPLEIRVNGAPLSVTMRTPGSDVELAQGFLLTEGIISRREDVLTARYCSGAGDGPPQDYNVLEVTLAGHVPRPEVDLTRNFYTSSSCGVCGKSSLEAVRLASRYGPADDPVRVAAATLTAMPDQLRAAQTVFARTGGLHAAALFSVGGEVVGGAADAASMLVVREDVGRHNAVDKVIGWALEHGRVPLAGTVLMVSGRASFELTQKAVMAGVPVLAAVSAPSSLAVDLAAESGLTLVAFLRGDSMNVYSRPDRVVG
ncbi:formate dehydrogenase accessory sulfurtransferase FdhD [[Mycobacterium] nativiensis]|uniref:Sulfur carrier protein FdhD n=1 Tax=[Mycobacterium] nativiensis TaxID=2855503 RepID=A0ABU5XWJ3_9MYCO|nr:formate dehydrogenase accessory sulfurtransferase FdhD [Mycolicibacter sp. MYC340]MEB3032340.1 formate dehydrogenase accessory sulfurtransferase FdhD [Mycolicibacter sp. MYC340]